MTLNLKRYTHHLSRLVAQRSVSCALPEWDTSNKGVIDQLAEDFSELGFQVEVIAVPEHPGKYNLLATLGRGEGGLVFAGHSDTVPFDAKHWSSDPFTLTERDGKLYGLGATDMKGFFPAVMEAVRDIDPTKLQAPIIVLATADEESSMSGARALLNTGIAPGRYAVVGEPTGMRPINMHKGILMESIRVLGKSGHSSNPALGNSALEAMHEVTGELIHYRQELQTRFHNPGFTVAVPTLNLGCIHGGDGANRICGECELHFDLRSVPGMHNDELRAEINHRLAPIAERRQIDIVFSTLFEGVDPLLQPRDSDLIRACEMLTGVTAEAVGFATEAPFYRQLDMQAVVMGPGSIDQAHQPDEFIAIDQLAPAIKVLKSLIHHFCQRQTSAPPHHKGQA
ncbi:acetylornithine deacetylase [Gilvimarinus polysaccharolyticus]|uniref:acetylornithine deacetylase n=1 Tax=Gilvimarinus polysaccharolyticus TaxID=863921 RepID=UPI0006735E15|nr:acetylornithine deacetylase [Gilvimarinus polysaccharolyticus]